MDAVLAACRLDLVRLYLPNTPLVVRRVSVDASNTVTPCWATDLPSSEQLVKHWHPFETNISLIINSSTL